MLQQIAPKYVAQFFHRQNEKDLEFIFRWQPRLTQLIDGSTDHIIIVPCGIGDTPSKQFFRRLSEMLLEGENRVLILFANGPDDDARWSDHIAILKNYEQSAPNQRAAVVELRTELRRPIGAIRGLVSDMLIVAAYNFGLKKLLMTHNDADTLNTSRTYYSSIEHAFCEGAGVISCDTIMATHNPKAKLGYDFSVLELIALNAFENVIKRMAVNGSVNFEQRLWLDAANMAIDAVLYCDVGGFDYQAISGEDDRIGRAVHRYRPEYLSKGPITFDRLYGPGDAPRAAYLYCDWIISDGRRAIRALADGHRVDQAWSKVPFSEIHGSDLNLDELIDSYNSNPDSLAKIISGNSEMMVRQHVEKWILAMANSFADKDFRIRNETQRNLFFDEVRSAPRQVLIGDFCEDSECPDLGFAQEVVFNALKTFGK